ncbi:protein of unknown function [Cyanobium sp. NIES-981]|nr:protein of unknown function [Cyanobium sp. NIES-981]
MKHDLRLALLNDFLQRRQISDVLEMVTLETRNKSKLIKKMWIRVRW